MFTRRNNRYRKIAREKLKKWIPFTDADLAMNDDGFFLRRSKSISNQKPILRKELLSVEPFT